MKYSSETSTRKLQTFLSQFFNCTCFRVLWLFLNRAIHGKNNVNKDPGTQKVESYRPCMSSDLMMLQDTSCLAEGEGTWCSARSYMQPWGGESLLITTTLGSDGQYYLTDCIVPGYKLHASKSFFFPFWPGWGSLMGSGNILGPHLALAYIAATGSAPPAV